MLITKTSMMTGKLHTLDIPVTEEQLKRWQNGEVIQRAMPDLSVEDREFLLTGSTAEEWKDTFSEEEQ